MASSSSSINTPLVVEIKNRPCPIFKKHLYKSLLDESLGAFSQVYHGVLHTEDIRAYIHCNIEELGGYELSCVLTAKTGICTFAEEGFHAVYGFPDF